MKNNKRINLSLISIFTILLFFAMPVTAHQGTEERAYVRVVSADPSTGTYTFSCFMESDQAYPRDFFIRPDYGDFNQHIPNEAESLDRPQGDHFTYTFKENTFYHVGCIIVDETDFSTLYRGDLHIDLREGAWDPAIVPVSGDGLSTTLECQYSGGQHSVNWDVLNAQTGEFIQLGTGERITYTAPSDGLYDFICNIHDHETGENFATPMPVEFFHQGDPYFPTAQGVPHPITTDWDNTDSSNQDPTSEEPQPPATNDNSNTGDTSSGDSSSSEQPSSGDLMCHQSVETIPVSCSASLTLDSWNGCRSLICEDNSGFLQVLACDKPDIGTRIHFEMYKQGESGVAPQLCIGETCIHENGFAQSGEFPICPLPEADTGSEPTVPSNSSDNSNSGSDDSNEVSICYESLELIPAMCNGEISVDTYNGCRSISCSKDSSSLTVLACPKPDSGMKTHFEMYKQSQSGSGVEICLADSCIKDNGYVQSNLFPICTNAAFPPTGTNAPPENSSDDASQQQMSQLLTAPSWIAPQDGLQNVAPNHFHIELSDVPNADQHTSTDAEVWKNDFSEIVWQASEMSDQFKYHFHTPDGIFVNSLAGSSQLEHATTYKVRVRYKDTNGAYSPWSTWRTFTTNQQPSGTSQDSFSSSVWQAAPGFRVEKFASGFDVPVHVAAAPQQLYLHLPENERPFLYVTELYGKVKVVFKDGRSQTYATDLLNFPAFGSITGGGQMGVVGLYADPSTGDLFVGTTYVQTNAQGQEEVKNKLVRFYTTDNGLSYTHSQTIIDNLPSAPSHQIEQITKGPDGKLYIGLGDALIPSNAQDDTILAGKIIRVNLDGSNPEIYAKGVRNPFGLDWRPGFNQLFATDNAPDVDDRLIHVQQGENYGWGMNDNFQTFNQKRIATLDPSPVDVEFNGGNNHFPAELTSKLYVAVAGPIYQKGPTNGKYIREFTLDNAGNVMGQRDFVTYVGNGYGTPIGLDFAEDGLYFTDIYGEPGFIGLGDTEANIYRVVPGDPQTCTECETGSFRAGISVIPWYPKDTGDGIEYIFECQGIDGSGNYHYSFNFGDGTSASSSWDRQYHKYPYGDVDYQVSCTVQDLGTGQQATAQTTVNPDDFIPER